MRSLTEGPSIAWAVLNARIPIPRSSNIGTARPGVWSPFPPSDADELDLSPRRSVLQPPFPYPANPTAPHRVKGTNQLDGSTAQVADLLTGG